MYFIIDTCVFRKDLLAKSRKFETFKDYLNKTKSKIIMPQIVHQELKGVYKRELEQRCKRYVDTEDALSRVLVDGYSKPFNLDTNSETEKYIRYLHDMFKIATDDIVPYKNEYLPEVVVKSIERKKPFSEKKVEFRDALLWLTILDFAAGKKKKSVYFISSNVTDFADENKIGLHPDLIDEALKRKIEVNYFPSIDMFLEMHAIRIKDITNEWLKRELEEKDFIDQLEEYVVCDGYDALLDWYERTRTLGYKSVYPQVIEYSIAKFYVYEMKSKKLRIGAKIIASIELEEFDEYHESQIVELVADLHILVKNKKISEIEISNPHFY